jgi:N-acetyl-1-D-myo-inositol-2-amino-2-deoxy-alpha-D-glucopyranoside deacetylase
MRAVELAAAAGWTVPKVYWVVVPKQLALQAIEAIEAMQSGGGGFGERLAQWKASGLPSMFVADELVTSAVDGSAFLEHKAAALREHATQVTVDGPFFALSNGVGQPLVALEFYQLVRGTAAGDRDDHGWETDLFGGVEPTG